MSTQLGSAPSRSRLLSRALRLADAAAAPHGIDRYLELLAPTWSTSDIRARVLTADRRSRQSVTLTLRPNRNWQGFEAGQYTMVTVEIGGVRHSRCYSMAGSAHRRDGLIELTVKAHPGGTVSRYLVDHAQPGLVVTLSPAQGSFTLPDVRPRNLVLISGGSGVTPVMSMLRTLEAELHRGPVTFLHYVRSPADNVYRDELASMSSNVRVAIVHTSVPGGGHFTPEHLGDAAVDAETEVFVCGPRSLRQAVHAHLTSQGWGERYHEEAFSLSQDGARLASEPRPRSGVTFTTSGRTVEDDGRSLLLQARAAGLSPTYGCGIGICHTCTAHLTEGAVCDLTTGEITRAGAHSSPVGIQICIHKPAGGVAVDL